MVRTLAPRTLKTLACFVLCSLFFVAQFSEASAGNYRDYCAEEARRLSGYSGAVGDIAGGAIKGAVGAAILSGIFGGDKKDRKRAAGIGALLGGLGGAKRGNSRATRIYRLEFDDCMRRR
ncbi:MAG: hypothetical protein ACPGGK_14765 [Pikeienuella sp.]